MAVTCSGWLEKKKQKRYFVLRDSILWWFTDEPQNLYTDFTASSSKNKPRGSLQIEGLNLTQDDQNTGFELVATENHPGLGLLKPVKDTTANLAKWEEAIREAIAHSGKELEKLKAQGMYKVGWMEKMGQKRYFVLRGSNLSWYIQPRDGAPQGVLDISQCECTPSKNGFVVTGSYIEKKYELKCESDETVEWLKAINNAKRVSKQIEDQEALAKSRLFTNQTVTFSGFLEKNGTQRFYSLNGKVLTWYLKNPAVVEHEKQKEETILGSLSLEGAHIIYTSGFSFTIQPLMGKVYTLKASTVSEATSWVRTLKVGVMSRIDDSAMILPSLIDKGWVKKKYTGSTKEHERYLVLTNTSLLYYDTEMIDGEGVLPKGAIDLLGSQTVHTNGSLFCVKSASGRLYPWQAADSETAEKWMTSITRRQHMLERDSNTLPKVDETKWGKLYVEVIKCTNLPQDMEGSVALKTASQQEVTSRSSNCSWDNHFLFEVEDLKGILEVTVHQHLFFGSVAYGVTSLPFLESREVKMGSSNTLNKPNPDSSKKEKELGEIEIRTQFVCYAPIVMALKDKSGLMLRALTKKVSNDTVASAIMYYAWLNGYHNELMDVVIKEEVRETQAEQQLFRLDSNATKLLIAFLRRLGKDWLTHLFVPLIDLVAKSPDFEVDPTKIEEIKGEDKAEKQATAQSLLKQLTTQFLEVILTKAQQTCPKDILHLCSVVYNETLVKFPESAQKAVGGIIFLRFLCPAITTPPSSVIREVELTPALRRKLLMIAKIIQNIANDVEFGKKEPFMEPFNPTIAEYKPMYQAFLRNLSTEHPTQDLQPVKLTFTLNIKEHRQNLDIIIDHWHKAFSDVSAYYEALKGARSPDREEATSGSLSCGPIVNRAKATSLSSAQAVARVAESLDEKNRRNTGVVTRGKAEISSSLVSSTGIKNATIINSWPNKEDLKLVNRTLQLLVELSSKKKEKAAEEERKKDKKNDEKKKNKK